MKMLEEQISEGIEKFVFFSMSVKSGLVPAFTYTIGAQLVIGHELAFFGGAAYSRQKVHDDITACYQRIKNGEKLTDFRLSDVERSWVPHMNALIAVDRDVRVMQIVPVGSGCTRDVPDMRFAVRDNPVWKFLESENGGQKLWVVCDLAILRGAPAVHIARWEVDQWEVFSTPPSEVNNDDARVIPAATMIGLDPRLADILEMSIGVVQQRSLAPLPIHWTSAKA